MNDLQELTAILESLNQAGSFTEAAERLTRWARAFTQCESAILRLLQENGDTSWLPGYVVDGAPTAFARDETVVRSEECICGRVAIGAIDASLPFFTEGGSFAWGRLTTLSRDFTAEQLGPLRGRCMEELFESLAVLPLRAGTRRVGSLHLADRRPDWFDKRLQVVEAACRIAGDTLLRYKTREREQAVLRTIETALLPALPPAVDGLEVGVSFTSATEMARVGGDFYDVLDLGSAGALVLVGDVSGKGVEAAGIAAKTRYTLAAQANLTPDPETFMSAANDSLARLLPDGRFVAVAACLIDRLSGTATTCLAGHPAPLIITPSGTVEVDAPHNPPLGLFPGLRFAAVSHELHTDDFLIVYTDGVTDSSRGNHFFGREGIIRAVEKTPNREPWTLANSVWAAATGFHDSSRTGDDRLVLVVRRQPTKHLVTPFAYSATPSETIRAGSGSLWTR